MPNKYNVAINAAKEKYTHPEPRVGKALGFFARLRHSFSEYPELKAFVSQLSAINDDASAKRAIEAFIQERTSGRLNRQHNHSFISYLLDELLVNFPDENWGSCHPNTRQFKFYYGTVYRGTGQYYENAFEFGIPELGRTSVSDKYLGAGTYYYGTSTSKSKALAQGYASGYSMCRHSGKVTSIPGYLYKIDLSLLRDDRRVAPIDLLATEGHRGDYIFDVEKDKQEVNVRGDIPASAIVCAWFVEHGNIVGPAIKNQQYTGRLTEADDSRDEPENTDDYRIVLGAFAPAKQSQLPVNQAESKAEQDRKLAAAYGMAMMRA